MPRRLKRNKVHVDIMRLVKDQRDLKQRQALLPALFNNQIGLSLAADMPTPATLRRRRASNIRLRTSPVARKSVSRTERKRVVRKKKSEEKVVESDHSLADLIRQVTSKEYIQQAMRDAATHENKVNLKPNTLLRSLDRAVEGLAFNPWKIYERFANVNKPRPKNNKRAAQTAAKANKFKPKYNQCPLCVGSNLSMNFKPKKSVKSVTEDQSQVSISSSCSQSPAESDEHDVDDSDEGIESQKSSSK